VRRSGGFATGTAGTDRGKWGHGRTLKGTETEGLFACGMHWLARDLVEAGRWVGEVSLSLLREGDCRENSGEVELELFSEQRLR
jgi:hypothetical protein